jgi:type I restriction enzyme S subunit
VSPAKQAAIASFLDRETARIDALIEKKSRFIELLREKRQALITRAVTRGLEPGVPFKDSGVDTLGEVPAHYRISRLMHLTAFGRDIMYGIVLPGPNVEEGIPIVKGGNVKAERLRLDQLARTTVEIEAPFARARLRPNDIVYSIRGSIGDAELVPEELLDANITQDVARVSPGPGASARWLLYVLKSTAIFTQLDRDATGATIRGINIFSLKRVLVPVPPLAEQESIAAYLDQRLAEMDRLAGATERSVRLLMERRAALIAAAVTGQIDVREAV